KGGGMPRIRPVEVECRRPRHRARSVSGGAAAVGLFALTFCACAPGSAMERSSSGSHAARSVSRVVGDSPVRGWMTTAGGSRRGATVGASEIVGGSQGGTRVVAFDPSVTFQQVDGFGGAVLESSVRVLDALPQAKRDAALRALFDPVTGAGFSYVRIA